MKPTSSLALVREQELEEWDFYGFKGPRIIYAPRLRSSFYYPSSHMMDYIVHCMNKQLADNFYFKQATPKYHPYTLRLYFGVIFWIQCLRAGKEVLALAANQHQFLSDFLAAHPPETLPIPGPLMLLFRTLCASQPQFTSYGKVYPCLPRKPGPNVRSEFMTDILECHMLPNIPGIFALLEHLNSMISNADEPVYPKLGRHTPVTENPTIFGHHSFPPLAERSSLEKWSLVSSGLQYPCEADQKLNEAFAECYQYFSFPTTTAEDNLTTISSFLGTNKSMAWFTLVKRVASTAATFFEGSGTLEECDPSGLVANQITAVMTPPKSTLPAPTHSADKRSLFGFSYKLKSTARNLSPREETAAAFAQTHIRMFDDHPYYSLFGMKFPDHGPFWSIRSIESSPKEDCSYLSICPLVAKMIKHKGRT